MFTSHLDTADRKQGITKLLSKKDDIITIQDKAIGWWKKPQLHGYLGVQTINATLVNPSLYGNLKIKETIHSVLKYSIIEKPDMHQLLKTLYELLIKQSISKKQSADLIIENYNY
jgi:hypothetical protein